MQEVSSPPLRPPVMPFSEFLAALFQSLDREGVRYCVLRNYEGFPTNNVGSDIDFLISPSQLPNAIRALQSIEGIRIVGYAERYYVAHLFVEGVSVAPGVRTLGVDFIWGLVWKGVPYLPTSTLLQAAVPRQAGKLNFFVPSPVHEAITSLFGSLLSGGWTKEKYFPKVQRTFAGERTEVIAALSPQFGLKAATPFANAVIDGDRSRLHDCVRPLHISLVRRGLLQRPLRSSFSIARYYVREFAVRCAPRTLEAVCILAPDGRGGTTIIENLEPQLKYSAKLLERCKFGPGASLGSQLSEGSVGAPRSGSFASMASTAQRLADEWRNQFRIRQNLTLRIADGSYADLLTDPKSHGYGGPTWFARLAGKLFPSPDLWILLDPDPEGLQSRDREAPSAESLRKLEACRAFVKTRKSYVILDASRPAASVTEEAYAAIIDTLARRAARQLKRRF